MANHNLPPQPTSFIGRDAEIADIVNRLHEPGCRLLTLVGPGGIGKTRLAIEAGARMVQHFSDGVFFVPLQAINMPENMVSLMASSLNFQFYDGADATQQLQDFLFNKAMLLLMDNFEHILAGAELVRDIIAAAPQVAMLVTSREPLNLRAEWLYQVSGLHYGKASDAELHDNHAIQLFAERARQVRSDFSTDDEREEVLRIVRLVEGMPLAIELAATWLTSLPCAAIADEIQQNLAFLATNLRDIPARHQSMQAVFDYSWRMLQPNEQAVCMNMAVFRGGCTRAAAQAVTGASLETLSSLVEKSFLRRTEGDRYEIHELMRQYGEEHLLANGLSDAARDTHKAYYLNALAQRESDIKGARQLAALNEIEGDFENARVAWEWAAHRQDEDNIKLAIQCLFWYCVSRYRPQDGIALFQRALDEDLSEQTILRLRVHLIYLKVVGYQGNPELLGQLEEIREIVERNNSPSILAFCLATMGEAQVSVGRFDIALSCYEQALKLYHQLNDRFHMGRMLRRIGYCRLPNGQFTPAEEALRQGLDLSRSLGDRIGAANCLYNLGSVMGFANDFAGHEANYREALAIRREMGERAGTAMNLAGVAIPVYFRGDFAGAQELAEEAFDIASHINHQESKAMALAVLGLVAAVHEDYPGGRQLLTEARSLAVDGVKASWSELGLSMVACGEGDYASAKHHLQKMMEGQPALGGYYAAPFLHVLALINIHEGDAVSGIEIISLTRHHPEIGVMSATSEVWPLVSRLQARARADLGDDVYNAAWERGMALDYDKVLARLFDEISTTAESADGLLTDQMQAANQTLISPLTQREHEILFLIAQGLSNRQIAEQLVIAVSTVKRHVNNCYGKLDVSSRTQAVIKAQNLKLV